MRPIKPSDPRVPQISDLCCKASGGMSTPQIIKQTGFSRGMCQMLLGECRKQQLLISHKPIGGAWSWMSPADHKAMLDAVSSDRLMRRREEGRALYHSRRSSGPIDSNNQITDPPDWPIERRIVKADGSPLPFVCRAPNSVFALGGA